MPIPPACNPSIPSLFYDSFLAFLFLCTPLCLSPYCLFSNFSLFATIFSVPLSFYFLTFLSSPTHTHTHTHTHFQLYFNHALYSLRLIHSVTKWSVLTNMLNFPSRYLLFFVFYSDIRVTLLLR